MNQQEIKQILRGELEIKETSSQYNIGKVKFHTHNGIDSPRLNSGQVSIEGKLRIKPINLILAGQIALDFASGSVTITDKRITSSSIIVATDTITSGGIAFQAYCSDGSATINYVPNTTTQANYIIII